MKLISQARTLEQFRTELCKEIERRLQLPHASPNATKARAIIEHNTAVRELEALLAFVRKIEFAKRT